MYKLNPNNKFQVPSGNLTKLFEKNEPKKFLQPESSLFDSTKRDMIRVEPPKIEKSPDQLKLEEDRANFEVMVKDKFSKVDEILMLLKEKQDVLLTAHTEKQQLQNDHHANQNPNLMPSQPQEISGNRNEQPVISGKLRTKRTYYPITETMWENVKSSYPDLPESAKSSIFSDGVGYFLESKNKKIELDNKAVLKLLNKK